MNRPIPDEVILGLLKAQPTHGYELLEKFRSPEHLGRVWTMSTSQLYAVLKRLENEGAIIGNEIVSKNAPAKTIYSVTDKGTHTLNRWIFDPHPSMSIHRMRVEFLSRLYIAKILKTPFDRIVKLQMSVCVQQHQKMLKEKQQAGSPMERLALEFVIGQLQAAISWLEQCVRDIQLR